MRTRRFLVTGLAMLAVMLIPAGLESPRAQALPPVALTGQVISIDEGAMEGVLVSARKTGSTVTITVVSDPTRRLASQLTNAEWLESVPGTPQQKASLLGCGGWDTRGAPGNTPLMYQPGTTWEYSRSTDVLGRLGEVVSGFKTLVLGAFADSRELDVRSISDSTVFSRAWCSATSG